MQQNFDHLLLAGLRCLPQSITVIKSEHSQCKEMHTYSKQRRYCKKLNIFLYYQLHLRSMKGTEPNKPLCNFNFHKRIIYFNMVYIPWLLCSFIHTYSLKYKILHILISYSKLLFPYLQIHMADRMQVI